MTFYSTYPQVPTIFSYTKIAVKLRRLFQKFMFVWNCATHYPEDFNLSLHTNAAKIPVTASSYINFNHFIVSHLIIFLEYLCISVSHAPMFPSFQPISFKFLLSILAVFWEFLIISVCLTSFHVFQLVSSELFSLYTFSHFIYKSIASQHLISHPLYNVFFTLHTFSNRFNIPVSSTP
jgi:hypothetical protein